MNRRFTPRVLSIVFGSASGAFLILITVAISLLLENERALEQDTYDETGIASIQLRIHYETLMGALARASADASADEAVLQFDILYERVRALPNRPSYDKLLDNELLALQWDIRTSLEREVVYFDAAAEGDPSGLTGMQERLSPLRAKIERLAHRPVQIGSEKRAAVRAHINDLSGWLTAVIVAFMVCGAAFVFVIWHQMKVAVRRRAEVEESRDELSRNVGELEATKAELMAQAGSLRELAREHAEQTKRAEAASRVKSEFLATMSHEIRTPLNGVLGMADILLRSGLSDTQQAHAKIIRQSGDALLVILNDILDLSKIESEKLEIEHLPFDLPALIDGVAASWRLQAEGKGLVWSADTDREAYTAPYLLSDQVRVRQILNNLAANALKFTDEGRIELRVTQAIRPDDLVETRFEFRDTGIGIAEDHIESIFDNFTQADSSISRRYGGSGLGLAVCKRLSGLLGGDIGVESKPGEGSCFWFTILCPRAEAPVEDDGNSLRTSDTDGPLPKLRILVAEDNDVNQALISLILTSKGYECQLVENGRAACEAVQSERFDLVLMDVRMPEMDGLTAVRRIRGLPSPAGEVPIIALTACSFPEDRKRAFEAGVNDYVTKPIEMDVLFAAIDRLSGGQGAETSATRDVA